MNPEELKQSTPNLDPNKSAAALAFATMLSEQLMPKVAPEKGQEEQKQQDGLETPETAPEQEEKPESGVDTMKQEYDTKFNEIEAKLEGIKTEIKELLKSEISGIKESIQEALNDGQS